jgi:hypothetical protein
VWLGLQLIFLAIRVLPPGAIRTTIAANLFGWAAELARMKGERK